jgi:ATP-binding protein involved in chromosome partitioning
MSTNPFSKQAPIAGIKRVILVGSGKGGVGKSTVAANLALSLKGLGHSVGLLDADIFGPSIPRMFGAINQIPEVDAAKRIQPIVRHGLNLMSIGFLIDEGSAVVWRGPMLFKAMEQFFRDVNWGELDYLVIDLPPGTGDVPLTVAQKIPVDGAVVVCTPQNLSLVDARKAIDMFDQVNIPVFGVVENMAYLRGADGERTQLFPRGELDSYLDSKKLEKLGVVPFHPSVALASEAGIPVVLGNPDGEEALAFRALAKRIVGFAPVGAQ